MQLQAILWDFDGTIVDNEELHFRSWQQSLAPYGIDHTYEEFRRSFGRRNGEIIPELLGEASTPELVERIAHEKERTYRALLQQEGLPILPGVESWLERFQARGLHQAIASSGPMANIVAMVQTLQIGDYFNSILSGARLPRGKPDPAIFLQAAAALGIAPHACLVIEDSLAGIAAARRADMVSVAVGKVIHTPALHERLEATPGRQVIFVESLLDLSWVQLEVEEDSVRSA